MASQRWVLELAHQEGPIRHRIVTPCRRRSSPEFARVDAKTRTPASRLVGAPRRRQFPHHMPRTPAPPPDSSDPLAPYRAKRSLERTPEPAGAIGRTEGRLFVVHLHDATRL